MGSSASNLEPMHSPHKYPGDRCYFKKGSTNSIYCEDHYSGVQVFSLYLLIICSTSLSVFLIFWGWKINPMRHLAKLWRELAQLENYANKSQMATVQAMSNPYVSMQPSISGLNTWESKARLSQRANEIVTSDLEEAKHQQFSVGSWYFLFAMNMGMWFIVFAMLWKNPLKLKTPEFTVYFDNENQLVGNAGNLDGNTAKCSGNFCPFPAID